MSGPTLREMALLLSGQNFVAEYFARVDRRDVDGAVLMYAEDAVFLGALGRAEIRRTMEKGLAAHADRPTRHVIANVRASLRDPVTVLVEYTALAYTLGTDGPLSPRSILDQEMHMRAGDADRLLIAEHRIAGFRI